MPASSLDADKPTNADTGVGIEIQNLVGSTIRSADGILDIIVVGCHAVGADSLDQVEVSETCADSIG